MSDPMGWNMADKRYGNNSSRPFGCMPGIEVMPCGHVPPKKHKSRGMCHTCYKRWRISTGRESYKRSWRSGRRKPPPVTRVAGPRGNRIELWTWNQYYTDINDGGGLFTRRVEDVWAVEFKGKEITGAFGPLDGWNSGNLSDMIIRNAVVIETIERRRDEFTKIKQRAA